MIYRDVLQQIIYKVINPLIKGMIKIGMTPNSVTTIGFLLNVVAAVVLVYGGLYHQGEFSFLTWFGALVLFAGLFDMMDGRLARMGNMSSTFGAMYDSVLDRYSELITLSGVCYWLFVCDYQLLSIVTFVALIGSIMVSYIRARAEGLGVECKVGFMQRPERVVLISLGALFTGIFKETKSFDSIWILGIALVLIAVLANVTAFVRLNHCKREMFKQEGKEEINC